jgi:hypothetical protein
MQSHIRVVKQQPTPVLAALLDAEFSDQVGLIDAAGVRKPSQDSLCPRQPAVVSLLPDMNRMNHVRLTAVHGSGLNQLTATATGSWLLGTLQQCPEQRA